MDDKLRKQEEKILYAIIILLILSLGFLAGKNVLTGRVIDTEEYSIMKINEIFDETTIYQIELDSNISSLLISGKIIGSGTVKIYLDDLVVFDHYEIQGEGLSAISGLVIENITISENITRTEEKNVTIESEETTIEENITIINETEKLLLKTNPAFYEIGSHFVTLFLYTNKFVKRINLNIDIKERFIPEIEQPVIERPTQNYFVYFFIIVVFILAFLFIKHKKSAKK